MTLESLSRTIAGDGHGTFSERVEELRQAILAVPERDRQKVIDYLNRRLDAGVAADNFPAALIAPPDGAQ